MKKQKKEYRIHQKKDGKFYIQSKGWIWGWNDIVIMLSDDYGWVGDSKPDFDTYDAAVKFLQEHTS